MPCGWGCGEDLTAVTIREHFAKCKKRGELMSIVPASDAFTVAAQKAGLQLEDWMLRVLVDGAAREMSGLRQAVSRETEDPRAERIRLAKAAPAATTEDDRQKYVPMDGV